MPPIQDILQGGMRSHFGVGFQQSSNVLNFYSRSEKGEPIFFRADKLINPRKEKIPSCLFLLLTNGSKVLDHEENFFSLFLAVNGPSCTLLSIFLLRKTLQTTKDEGDSKWSTIPWKIKSYDLKMRVSSVSPYCTKIGSNLYSKCIQNVLKMYPNYAQNVSKLCLEYIQNAFKMYPNCTKIKIVLKKINNPEDGSR